VISAGKAIQMGISRDARCWLLAASARAPNDRNDIGNHMVQISKRILNKIETDVSTANVASQWN